MWVGTVPRLLYISFSFLPANCNCAQQEKCPFVAEQMFLRRNPPSTVVTRPHNFSHGGIKAAERPFRKRERSETQNGCRESKSTRVSRAITDQGILQEGLCATMQFVRAFVSAFKLSSFPPDERECGKPLYSGLWQQQFHIQTLP